MKRCGWSCKLRDGQIPLNFNHVIARLMIMGAGKTSWAKDGNFRHLMEMGVCMELGPNACARIAGISAIGLVIGKSIKDSWEANAVRHFVWQASLTVVLDPSTAKLVGDVHELGMENIPSQVVDSRADRYNNRVARRWATGNYRELKALQSGPAVSPTLMAYLYAMGRRKYRSGELIAP